jgi:hypothetical protein
VSAMSVVEFSKQHILEMSANKVLMRFEQTRKVTAGLVR